MATESSVITPVGGGECSKPLDSAISASSVSEKDRRNFTKVLRGLENAEKGLKTFWDFLKPYRGLVGLVFILGVVLALFSDMVLAPKPVDPASWISSFRAFAAHMIGYIAHGMIVSSICVFGFEYLREARGDFKRTEKKDGLIVSLDEAVRALGEVGQTSKILQKVKTDLEALRAEVSKDIGRRVTFHCFAKTEAERMLAKSLNGIIQYASELKRTQTPDSQLYLEFIGWLCDVIQGNAQSLALLEKDTGTITFSDELDDWGSQRRYATYTVKWPTSPEVAARMSGTKMKGLGPGDSYCAVSNVLFWNKKEMEFFMTETETACQKRDVRVRRIFNLCNLLYMPGLLEQKFDFAKAIVEWHLELQRRTNGKYEVRFFGPEQVEKAFKTDGDINNRHSLSYTAFALFNRADHAQRDIVRYRTEDKELSQMTLGRADVTKYCDRFEMMWNLCEGVPNPFDSDVDGFKEIMGHPRW